MKVGIITRHAYPNYGSLLQAYALQEAVNQLGYEAVCIDYINKSEDSWHLCFSQLKESRMNSNLLKRIAYCVIQLPNYTINTYAFRKQQLKYLNLTNKFHSEESISLNDVNVYCTGSDQVWNQIHNSIDTAYFLEFTRDEDKRVSYAASFGRDFIDNDDIDTIRRLLKRYSKVAVREESGVSLLNELGIKSQRVVDPVLLYDSAFWGKHTAEVSKKNFVLIYQLHYNRELTEIAHNLAKEKNMTVIRLTCELKQRFIKEENVIYLPDLATFLGYIRSASYVVTDSFHGTVFSLIFHKQFIEVMPGVNKTRNENLLKMTHLEDRFENNNVVEIADRKIDYTNVDCLLNIERAASWEYLKNALNTD